MTPAVRKAAKVAAPARTGFFASPVCISNSSRTTVSAHNCRSFKSQSGPVPACARLTEILLQSSGFAGEVFTMQLSANSNFTGRKTVTRIVPVNNGTGASGQISSPQCRSRAISRGDCLLPWSLFPRYRILQAYIKFADNSCCTALESILADGIVFLQRADTTGQGGYAGLDRDIYVIAVDKRAPE